MDTFFTPNSVFASLWNGSGFTFRPILFLPPVGFVIIDVLS